LAAGTPLDLVNTIKQADDLLAGRA
jgi:hypothetical protein